MPFVVVRANMPISAQQEAELAHRLGRAIGHVPGKSEAGLMLAFEGDARLWLAGSDEGPCAYVEASVFANESHAGYAAFAAEVAAALEDVLGIPGRRSYVRLPTSPCGALAMPCSTAGCSGNAMDTKVKVTRFSDPMMGLAWECEPALRDLQEKFGGAVDLREAMVVLVRDVADFMAPAERALPPEEGLAAYNARLAQIGLRAVVVDGLLEGL